MIDGLKLRITGRARRRLRRNERIEWRPNGTFQDGRPRFRGTWQGFIFMGDDRECWEFRGSFHKYHEGGKNVSDFTLSHFVRTVIEVCNRLRLHPSAVIVCNIEIGVNVCPPIPTREVLVRIIMHKGARPTRMKGAAPGHGITIEHTAFRYKWYDKADQNDMEGELLRAEVAFHKMAAVKAAIWPNKSDRRTVTLADLLDPAVWQALKTLALRRFDELLILEPDVNTDGLSEKDRDLLSNAMRPDYWEGLKRSTRCDQRRRLDRIIMERGTSHLKAELRQRIADKFTAAIDMDARTNCPRVEQVDTMPTDTPDRTSCPLVIKGQNVRGEVFAEVAGVEVRRCLTCGRDITDQKRGSVYCSEKRFGKAAKKCRNSVSNPAHSRARSIERITSGGLLFDHGPFIRPQDPLRGTGSGYIGAT